MKDCCGEETTDHGWDIEPISCVFLCSFCTVVITIS